ncbi:MAG TPA: alpha/beta hydrolase-fold protein [Bryobacteraceae bacterium]|jgi:enterochelin esterase family protein|nr:alpha/beta hydrolase-fold protein [Bryobacteraceae bacterium]
MTTCRNFMLPLALATLFFAGAAGAQTAAPAAAQPVGRGGRGGGAATPVTALVSPEVHPDRTVTFRFRAPQATQVQLVGEILQGKGPQAMAKDEAGLWTVTIGPVPPEIWIYNFRVHGVDVTDPSNPAVKPVPPGFAMSSFVEVPGESPSFYDSRPVTHGDVRMVEYESKTFGVTRTVWIYTPPNYDKSRAKYPVLYLLHGNGEAFNGWVMNGRANVILDNLIADRKARPMIVVMPQGHALQAPSVGPLVRIQGESGMFSPRFPKDLLEEVVPLVEQNYRVVANADNRAIAGLSMGGGQALSIGLTHPELFHYVLGFSAAIGGQFLNIDETVQSVLANPAAANAKFHLLWISVGRQDFLFGPDQQLAKALRDGGVKNTYRETEGAHVWSVWRNNLNESAPLLFRAGAH